MDIRCLNLNQDVIDEVTSIAADAERARCYAIAADWFTLPPKLRTKARLLELIASEDKRYE